MSLQTENVTKAKSSMESNRDMVATTTIMETSMRASGLRTKSTDSGLFRTTSPARLMKVSGLMACVTVKALLRSVLATPSKVTSKRDLRQALERLIIPITPALPELGSTTLLIMMGLLFMITEIDMLVVLLKVKNMVKEFIALGTEAYMTDTSQMTCSMGEV